MGYDGNSKIDLHIHSTASDGSLHPSQILEQAVQLGLAAISITDHDTLEGSRQALDHGIPSQLAFLTGVEISSNPPESFPGGGSLHILGYGLRVDDAALCATLSRLQEARKNRNPKIVERLAQLGIRISLDEVREEVGEGQLGRPHIARLLLAKGIVGSLDEAFDVYLGKGRPAYVEKYRVDCRQAIQQIRQAGGIAVLAHPGLLQKGESTVVENLVSDLKASGLEGIEVYYSDHSRSQTAAYLHMAEKYGLLVTGGSDFHGKMFPDVKMGIGTGDLCIPVAVYEKITARIAKQGA